MAGINLLELEKTTLSRDLSGYITYIYGPGKIGKTSFGVQLPKPLLIALERGYNALPGVYAQDIRTWAEMKLVLRELKKPAVQEKFKSLIIDTIDIAVDLCTKYICNQEGVSELSQIQWGQGWTKVKKELESTFREITQMGYAVLFISHDKDKEFTRTDGSKYNQIVPTMGNSFNEIIRNMADFYVYAHMVPSENGGYKRVLTMRSQDDSIACGSRFKYIVPEVDLSYEAFVKAINDAIDKQVAEFDGKYVTDDRTTTNTKPVELNYDELMLQFNEIINKISNSTDEKKMDEYWAPRITEITDKYLGVGGKVSQCTRTQVEQIALIVAELQDLITEANL